MFICAWNAPTRRLLPNSISRGGLFYPEVVRLQEFDRLGHAKVEGPEEKLWWKFSSMTSNVVAVCLHFLAPMKSLPNPP